MTKWSWCVRVCARKSGEFKMLDWIDKYLFDYTNEKYAERFNKLQLGDFDTESDLVSGILSRMQVECNKHDWRFLFYPLYPTKFGVMVGTKRYCFNVLTDVSDKDGTCAVILCEDGDQWLLVSSVVSPKTSNAKIFVDKVLSSVVEYLTQFGKDGDIRE